VRAEAVIGADYGIILSRFCKQMFSQSGDQMTANHADQLQPAMLPCGSWPSPITPQSLTEATVRLTEPGTDGTDVY